jgi:LmbE family N-acetylglucosaminyl deacetylase
MLIAPHPDDESLACSIVLQHAVRAGASVRVVYATDGENNPWPQRVLQRKWRLDKMDRIRWGRLRRQEALNALSVLGVPEANAEFLALPDQGLTNLLLSDCKPALQLLAQHISEWEPTDLFWPALADTHPDHNALAVLLLLVLRNLLPQPLRFTAWNFLVHGNDAEFLRSAAPVHPSPEETAAKHAAIYCHKTQLTLSRRRFLAYAARPERFANTNGLGIDPRLSQRSSDSHEFTVSVPPIERRLRPSEPKLLMFGYDLSHCLKSTFASMLNPFGQIELLNWSDGDVVAILRSHGKLSTGLQITIPSGIFSADHPIYLKLERRRIFFDESGWIEIPAKTRVVPVPAVDWADEASVAVG